MGAAPLQLAIILAWTKLLASKWDIALGWCCTFSAHLLFWQVSHACRHLFWGVHSYCHWLSDTAWQSQWYVYLTVTVSKLVKPLFWDSAHLWFLYTLYILNHRIPTWRLVCKKAYMGTVHNDVIASYLCRSHDIYIYLTSFQVILYSKSYGLFWIFSVLEVTFPKRTECCTKLLAVN